MSTTLTFSQALIEALTAARKALAPEVHAKLADAAALVRNGHVFQARDGQTWEVASQTTPGQTYDVNGSCGCADAHFRSGAYCKHQLAVFLCRKVLQLMQQPPAPVVPDIVEPWPDNDVEEPTPETPAAPPTVPVPLPEAPASCNVFLTISGHKVQVTLRDGDEQRMLTRLQTLLDQYPAPQSAPQASSIPDQASGWCAVHETSMRLNEKNGQRWFSHRLESGEFCKGRVSR